MSKEEPEIVDQLSVLKKDVKWFVILEESELAVINDYKMKFNSQFPDINLTPLSLKNANSGDSLFNAIQVIFFFFFFKIYMIYY